MTFYFCGVWKIRFAARLEFVELESIFMQAERRARGSVGTICMTVS